MGATQIFDFPGGGSGARVEDGRLLVDASLTVTSADITNLQLQVGDVDVSNSNPVPTSIIAFPASTLAGAPAVTADFDTGAGTQNLPLVGIGLPGSGGASAGGTSSKPLRIDPTGTTTQPVSVASVAAGDNNIGNVDVVTLPELPAGDNNIGNIDVVTLPALPAGNNNIGDVDVVSLPALAAGSNAIGTVGVTSMPSGFRQETFATTANGTTQNATAAPMQNFSLQVITTASAWTFSVQVSLDGSHWTTVLTHTDSDLTGVTKSVTGKPARYWRVICSALTLGGASDATGNALAMP